MKGIEEGKRRAGRIGVQNHRHTAISVARTAKRQSEWLTAA